MRGHGYKAYRVRYKLGIQDPFMGSDTRYHNVLFVETLANKGGQIFQVDGDLVSGMRYESKQEQDPNLSPALHEKIFLGYISTDDYPARLDQVLRTLPPPPRQRAFNVGTMRLEQIKPDGTFFAADESRPPFRKCTEWIEEQALPALDRYQLLHKDLHQAPLEGNTMPASTAQSAQIAEITLGAASTS